ncbi:YchJ family protein [Crenothrix sp.]|uniref:YchJ family protein n=1 Tax=Crenothrix sp. TaxID=3100433 RepID=UPI00374C9616
MTDCYCGSGQNYNECCEPYHTASKMAQTAEALMRSRYSAFVLGNESYLLATWDEAKRPLSLGLSGDGIIWQRLNIIRCNKGREIHKQGTVEFKAYYQQDGHDFVLHEISRFKKNQVVWFYVDGAARIIPGLAAKK